MLFRTALLAGIAMNLVAAPEVLSAQATSTPAERSVAIDRTRDLLEAYWKEHDPKYVAEDAVFVMMPSGEEIRGRDAIAKHINGFYHGALDARAEVVNSVFGENEGLLEALVVGKHTGVFAGIPATGRDVRVPIGVAYEVEDGLIKRARIYLMVNVLLQQIGPAPAPR
ncbi:MAG: ester cyclase [Gemmatimonadaceae bacterium]